MGMGIGGPLLETIRTVAGPEKEEKRNVRIHHLKNQLG